MMNDEQLLGVIEDFSAIEHSDDRHLATLCLNVATAISKLPAGQMRSHLLQQMLTVRSTYVELRQAQRNAPQTYVMPGEEPDVESPLEQHTG